MSGRRRGGTRKPRYNSSYGGGDHPKKKSPPNDEIVTVTATVHDDGPNTLATIASPPGTGKWVSLYSVVDIMGIQFEPIWSTGTTRSILSNRVYNLIKLKDSRYQLAKVTGIRVQDLFGNELKFLGVLQVPCKIICSGLTHVVRFLVIEDGAVDGVIGMADMTGEMHNFTWSRRHEPRAPVLVTANTESNNKESCSLVKNATPPERIVKINISRIEGKQFPFSFKMEIMGALLTAVPSSGSDGTILSSRVYNQIKNKLKNPDYQLKKATGIRVQDLMGNEMTLLGALQIPSKFICARGLRNITKVITFLVVDGGSADCVLGSPEIKSFNISLSFQSEDKLVIFMDHDPPLKIVTLDSDDVDKDLGKKSCHSSSTVALNSQEDSDVASENTTVMTSPVNTRVITITTLTEDKKKYSLLKMDIMGVQFEAVFSTESDGTILSTRVYNQIFKKLKNSNYHLDTAPGVALCDIKGSQMKLLGTLHIPCKIVSSRGPNSVTEVIKFMVVEGGNVDCVFGAPEILSCKISIILYRHLLVFNNRKPGVHIAMVGAAEDPSVKVEEIIPAEYSVLQERIITISIMTSTGRFPYMVKMNIMDIPFEAVLSTGSNGSVLSTGIYNQILNNMKDSGHHYKLEKVAGVRVCDIMGNEMKLLGALRIPCKIISARRRKSVTEPITFLVINDLSVDCVFGTPEIFSCDIRLIFEYKRNVMVFQNREPPVTIEILSE